MLTTIMGNNKMNIIELSKENINEIAGLWKELNSLHGELSSNFKSHFESFTFDNRVKQLSIKENLSIFVAKKKIPTLDIVLLRKITKSEKLIHYLSRKSTRDRALVMN